MNGCFLKFYVAENRRHHRKLAYDWLLEEAKKLGYLPANQTLQNMRAYPVEEERRLALKSGNAVLLKGGREASHSCGAMVALAPALPRLATVTVKVLLPKDSL